MPKTSKNTRFCPCCDYRDIKTITSTKKKTCEECIDAACCENCGEWTCMKNDVEPNHRCECLKPCLVCKFTANDLEWKTDEQLAGACPIGLDDDWTCKYE